MHQDWKKYKSRTGSVGITGSGHTLAAGLPFFLGTVSNSFDYPLFARLMADRMARRGERLILWDRPTPQYCFPLRWSWRRI